MSKSKVLGVVVGVALLGLLANSAPGRGRSGPQVIQIIAGKDGQFKVVGQKEAVITASPKEILRLRITAQKGSEVAPDGAVHGFWAPELEEQGWNLRLREGTEEFTLVAPEERGEYAILCSVECGPGHSHMQMKLVVR